MSDRIKQVLAKYGLPDSLIEELTQAVEHNNQFLNESHNAELLAVNDVHLEKIQKLESQIAAYEQYVQDEHESEISELKRKLSECGNSSNDELDELKSQIAEYEQYVQEEHQKLHEQIKLYESYALGEYQKLQESHILENDKMAKFLSAKAAQYVEAVIEEMAEQLDDYTQLVIEEFVNEKSGLIESVQDTIRAQEAMMKVKHLLEQYYFTVAPTKDSKPLMNENRDMARLYNELLRKHTEVNRTVTGLKRQLYIQEQIKDAGLNTIQESRVHKYMQEYPENKTPEEMSSYLKLIIEDVKKKKESPKMLKEDIFTTPEVQFNYNPVTFNPSMDTSTIAEWAKSF